MSASIDNSLRNSMDWLSTLDQRLLSQETLFADANVPLLSLGRLPSQESLFTDILPIVPQLETLDSMDDIFNQNIIVPTAGVIGSNSGSVAQQNVMPFNANINNIYTNTLPIKQSTTNSTSRQADASSPVSAPPISSPIMSLEEAIARPPRKRAAAAVTANTEEPNSQTAKRAKRFVATNEVERQERRLERNRMAAQACRDRKKNLRGDLSHQVQELQTQKRAIDAELDRLQMDNVALKAEFVNLQSLINNSLPLSKQFARQEMSRMNMVADANTYARATNTKPVTADVKETYAMASLYALFGTALFKDMLTPPTKSNIESISNNRRTTPIAQLV